MDALLDVDIERERFTSDQILGILSERHPQPSWAFVSELPNSTAMKATRRIDAYAVSLWSSPGIGHTIAYEIKVARSDFLNDLRDASKRQPAMENSNEFYYVSPVSVISADEVPQDCGLIHVQTGRAVIVKPAVQRNLDSISLKFAAALFRKMDGRPTPNYSSMLRTVRYAGGREMTLDDLDTAAREMFEHATKYSIRDEVRRELRDEISKSVMSSLLQCARSIGAFYKQENVSAYDSRSVESICRAIEQRVTAIKGNLDVSPHLAKLKGFRDEVSRIVDAYDTKENGK